MPFIANTEILFIINPNSGVRNTTEYVKEINNLHFNIAYIITENLSDLKRAINENIDKYKIFIVFGGDGTVNEVLKYLYNRDNKILGVFPTGSGNGFSKELGFGQSLKELITDINKGETVNVDVLSINNNKCINVAGLGFDSFVAHVFQKRKGRGLKNYIYATIKSIFTFKPFYAKLTFDNEIIEGKFQMIDIANTRQFGNNAMISPQSNPTDGIFELVLVRPFPLYLYPIFVIKLFSGGLKNSKYIRYIKLKNYVNIESEFKKYHIDGEPKTFTDKLSIKILEKKIKVIKTTQNKKL